MSLEEVPDLHNYVGWRDAFDPHLTALLQRAWTPMNHDHHELYSHAIGASGSVAVFGHYGRAVLAFPSEGGRAYDWRDNGMVGAIGEPARGRPGEALLRRLVRRRRRGRTSRSRWRSGRGQHGRYESWILDQVVPFIQHDTGGDIITTGSASAPSTPRTSRSSAPTCSRSRSACRATTTRRAWNAWGERGEQTYFNNPLDYVGHLGGDHLEWLRSRISLLLVCGQGQWEDTTGSLESTKRLAGLLAEKGIRHELDLWGYDVPHDWQSWRAQIAHHLPRFC